jgi:hypothetical protein
MRPGGAIYKTAPETTNMRKVHARMKDVNDLKLNPLRAIAIVLLYDIVFVYPGLGILASSENRSPRIRGPVYG